MGQSFRLRYVNEITGSFVLLALGLLIVGIYLAGHAQDWFQKRLILNATFPPTAGTYGLQEGAEVRVLGTLAGRVGEIVPGETGGMATTFVLKRKFRKFVRTDSRAKVKKKFELFGDAYVEITLGDPLQPELKSGSDIPCAQDEELTQKARNFLDDVRTNAVPMLDEFKQILSHVNAVTRALEEQKGPAGRLIGDAEWSRQLDGIVKDVKAMSQQLPASAQRLEAILADFKRTSESLQATASRFPALTDQASGVLTDARTFSGGLTGQVGNVENVLLQAEVTLREVERLIEGLQQHWLVRKYMPAPEATPTLSPLSLPAVPGGAP